MPYLKKILYFPRRLIISLVTLYQRTFSLDHGWFKGKYPAGYCKFKPTCSQYSKEALEKYGVIKGGWLSVWRVIRCNPWSKGGEDRVK